MRTTRTLAAAAIAGLTATLLQLTPADAASPTFQIKTLCQGDDNTRVRVIAKIRGKHDELVAYRWQVAGRDPHEGTVLMEAPYDDVMIAFTIPRGRTATVALEEGVDVGDVPGSKIRARRC